MTSAYTFVVVEHSTGYNVGGYVVRARYDGTLPAAYVDAEILGEYDSREKALDHATDLFRKACAR